MLTQPVDLNDGALMWEMPHSFADMATKYQKLGRPKKGRLGDHPWKQAELVKQLEIPLTYLGARLTWEISALRLKMVPR